MSNMLLKNIEPKPQTVQELFEGHPERWCKRAAYQDGEANATHPDAAVSCCILGAIDWVYGEGEDAPIIRQEMRNRMKNVLGMDWSGDIPLFNDNYITDFDKMLEKVKTAGI